MGALKGAITYSKFYVRGEVADDAHAKYLSRIRTRMFKALSPEDDSDVAVGWVPIERPFDDEIFFKSEGVFFGSYVNLGLRFDRWKFPTTLVKAKMAAAERAYKQKTGKERISRAEKAELRDLVERRLRREGVPVTKVVDLSWNMASGELRFFGRSKVIAEHFFELFEKTFALKLVSAGPYTTALSFDLPKNLAAALEKTEPTPLHLHG